MTGPLFSVCLKTTTGSVVGNPAGDGHWDQGKGTSVCCLFEACPSNKAVRVFEVGAITLVVSEPAHDLCYCRVLFLEEKAYGDGF